MNSPNIEYRDTAPEGDGVEDGEADLLGDPEALTDPDKDGLKLPESEAETDDDFELEGEALMLPLWLGDKLLE